MESHLSFSCFVEFRAARRSGGGHVVGDGLHLVGGQLEESLDEVAVDEVVRRDGLAIVLERAPLGVEQAADALDDARLAW